MKTPRMAAIVSGDTRHRSVRSVFSSMDARGRAPVGKVGRGLADVVVMLSLPERAGVFVPSVSGAHVTPDHQRVVLGEYVCDVSAAGRRNGCLSRTRHPCSSTR